MLAGFAAESYVLLRIRRLCAAAIHILNFSLFILSSSPRRFQVLFSTFTNPKYPVCPVITWKRPDEKIRDPDEETNPSFCFEDTRLTGGETSPLNIRHCYQYSFPSRCLAVTLSMTTRSSTFLPHINNILLNLNTNNLPTNLLHEVRSIQAHILIVPSAGYELHGGSAEKETTRGRCRIMESQ